MAIVFAGVLPHTPLLVPGVAKQHQSTVAGIRQDVDVLAGELHARQPDTVVIISPHGLVVDGQPVLFLADRYHGTLREFGDLQSKFDCAGDIGTGHHIKEVAEDHDVPLLLQTVEELDYGITVPALLIEPALIGRLLLPLSVGGGSPERLVELGSVLHEVFQTSRRRFAIVASADLSRRPKKQRLDPTAERPTKEERAISEAIRQGSITPLLEESFDPTTCGWSPLVVLLATLSGMKTRGEILNFKVPFGVGAMVAQITIGTS